MALGALSRRVLATQCRVVHVTGAFADQVNVVAAGIRDLVHSPLAQPRTEHEIEVPEVVAVNRFSLERWVGTPIDNSLTLVVIPQGIRARSLRTLVDRYASGSPTALVLVATQHRGFPFGFVRARKTALASQPG
jgi:hypothetical protein